MRCCATWKRRPIRANVTMAARPMWSSSSATSSGCSGGDKANAGGKSMWGNRILLGATLGACFAALLCGPADAQSWPTRPVTMVVPFAPGGVYDTLGRVYAAALSGVLGQQVIVENVLGAGG